MLKCSSTFVVSSLLAILVAISGAGCGSVVVDPSTEWPLDGSFLPDGALIDASRDASADGQTPGDGSWVDGGLDGSRDGSLDGSRDADAAPDATDIRDARPDAPLPDVFQLPDAPPLLVDAGCRDAGTRPSQITCDAFAQTGCPSTQGCFPYTIPPQSACDVETYGTTCRPAGTATQGQSCSRDGCAGGYVCIVGSGGESCARLCNLALSGQCPRGLTCQPVDVAGFGVCS